MGGPGSGPKLDLERRRRILELRAAGVSSSGIARRLGITPQAIHLHLKAAGAALPRRAPLRCRACDSKVAAGRHSANCNRPPLCLSCLAKCPDAPCADRLKAHRLASGLTQIELARRAGVPAGTIAGYESGKRRPGAGTLARLARALGVSCEVFVTDPPEEE